MEARLIRAAVIAAAVLSMGAGYRTQNFIVTAPNAQLAKEMCQAAEVYRRDLALEWLGKELPPWQAPCPITINVGSHLGAGGATSFMFQQGRPYGWAMNIQGSRVRLLDSVLPHEVTHTIFATHFGQPLPRWADEGACTTVEHDSEKNKQKQMLIQFLTTGRGIAFNRMFAMKEYPHDIMPLYSQGYSLARYLIAQGGKQKFVRYVGDGMKTNNWTAATQKHYGLQSLSELQVTWLDWVRRGSPPLQNNTALASVQEPPRNTTAVVPAAHLVPVPPLKPATKANTFAVRPSSDGWYSRHRPRPSRGSSKSLAHAKQPPVSRPLETRESPKARNDVAQSVTRPQPIGRPQQRILEWNQPPRPVQEKPTTPAPPATPGRSYYAAPPRASTTMWR